MEQSKHTPGPWKLADRGGPRGGEYHLAVLGPSGTRIVTITYRSDAPTAGNANAALIASAPDLLAALKAAEPWLGKACESGAFAHCALPLGGDRALDQLRAAIAKAE